jgi:hypothetical protein
MVVGAGDGSGDVWLDGIKVVNSNAVDSAADEEREIGLVVSEEAIIDVEDAT